MNETTINPDDLDAATARRRIEDFLTDYAHTIDDGALEDWPGFFTEDGFYQIISRESFEAELPVGLLSCEGRGMMVDRVRALREANVFEPHVYCHILGPARLEAVEGGYDVRSNFTVIRTMQDGGTETFAAGKYLDRIVFEGAVPKLNSRRVVLDSRRVDILLVLPL